MLKPGEIFVNALYTNETLLRFPHMQFGYKRFSAKQLISDGINAGFASNAVTILGGAAYCILYHKI